MKKLLCLLILSVATTASQASFCCDKDHTSEKKDIEPFFDSAWANKLRILQEMAQDGLSTIPEQEGDVTEPVIIDPLNFTNEFWRELLGFSLTKFDNPKSLIELSGVRGIDKLYFARKLCRVYQQSGHFIAFELGHDREGSLCFDCGKLLNKHSMNWVKSCGAFFHDYCFYTDQEYLIGSMNNDDLCRPAWKYLNNLGVETPELSKQESSVL